MRSTDTFTFALKTLRAAPLTEAWIRRAEHGVLARLGSLGRAVLLAAVVVALTGCSESSTTGPDMGEDLVDSGGDMGTCPIADCTNSIFVSATSGDDENPGSYSAPYRTVGHALLTANTHTIHVEAGIYNENVTLETPATLIGGYAPQFVTRPGDQRSVLRSTDPVDIIATTGPTVIDGFTFEAPDSAETSIALRILDASQVQLLNVDVLSGRGGPGIDGANGEAGANGDAGTPGQRGCEDGGVNCSACSRPEPGLGGASSCGPAGGNGGRPGHGSTSGENAQAGTDASGSEVTLPGVGGVTDQQGGDGTDGMDQPTAANGSGGLDFGTLEPSYITADGSPGSSGLHGSGGSGGGGGGGHEGGISFCDEFGGGGGGGGGGGCAGQPGAPGTGGGASFGMVVRSSSVSLENVRIVTSRGGDGGRGGNGGLGGDGGAPGLGGEGGANSGGGGAGGSGGKAGDGGHGGGGGGGPSVGIVCAGENTIEISGVSYQIGSGGAGGASSGEPGMLGLSAETHGCP